MKQSLMDNIQDVYIEQKQSKAGNSYISLVVEFTDGYKKAVPVFGDSEYIIRQHLNQD